MDAVDARERFARARSARLASVRPNGAPHLVPVCFALVGDTVVSAIDSKPKRTGRLQRIENIAREPRVALVADHYEDADWQRLWWVRADGVARVLSAGSDEAEAAVDQLARRYAQYRETRPSGPVLAVEVERWSGWSGA